MNSNTKLHFILHSWLFTVILFLSFINIPEKNIAVSIIVPVYNVEKYLGQCIDSILKQSLKNIELICVNDNSTDNSLEVIKGFAKLDNRVVIINNSKNVGPGTSRNTGINVAHGEYISFIDADDWINPDFLKKLYSLAKKHDADFTMCLITNFDQSHGQMFTRGEFSHTPPQHLAGRAFSWKDISSDVFSIPLHSFNKLYRRDFLARNNILFSDTYFLEDHGFSLKTILLAKRISYIPERLYVYRLNHQVSLSHTADHKLLKCFPEYKKLERIALAAHSDNVMQQTLDYIIQSAGLRSFGVQKSWRPDYVRIAKQFFKTSRLLSKVDYNKLSQMTQEFLHQLFLHMADDGVPIDKNHFKFHHNRNSI